ARRERAPKLGLGELPDTSLHAAVVERSRNWAEVRPEWGLAGNATFIVAPRERSRHLDLGGRAFLHDYRFEEDKDFAILELIMTAPLVVTHWINFQYYASTVDNGRYGSGNKVLHNVVGGHLGVFEGNGGDLRIGLSLQSLHDGERWMHAPLRLSVFIEAPRSAIDRVLEKHPKVRELVDNEWLHLFQIDVGERALFVRRNAGWARRE
ncbi:MAG TPA: putative inorganic carbon transporter subunit DabA, partial [Labilithrix sp.]|nr:putative inorganic carbon transporter subunit DabA [Labilithrix sp.]